MYTEKEVIKLIHKFALNRLDYQPTTKGDVLKDSAWIKANLKKRKPRVKNNS